MKKVLSIILISVLAISLLTACGSKLKDGSYTAEEADFDDYSGWKDNVTVEVKDGKITAVDWNSTHKDGGKDKKTSSKDGDYGMVAFGDAVAEWHEQAEKVESFLIEKQDVDAIKLDDEGKTDSVAGVTMIVGGFVDMVKDALSKAK
ncbi:MAG: FMN-binding protein [Clostridiales bacterium]|nr:FMN-binding protein [Clostridiales bacterium]